MKLDRICAGLFIVCVGCSSTSHTGEGIVGKAEQAATACSPPTTKAWLTSSPLTSSSGYFDPTLRNRVFVTDMDGDGKADVAAIASSGVVLVAKSTGAGYGAFAQWGTSAPFPVADNWFTGSYRQRVWIADMNNDGKADAVGIDDDGIINFYRNNGAGFDAVQTTQSVFIPFSRTVGDGWFDPPGSANPNSGTRVWLADVTGDGKTDFVGIGNAGDIWYSANNGTSFNAPVGPFPSTFSTANGWFQSTSQDRIFVGDFVSDAGDTGSSGVADIVGVEFDGSLNVAPGTKTRGFLSTVSFGKTVFATQWFSTSSQPRIFAADATGDGLLDLVGIAPNGQGDGDIWVARSDGTQLIAKPWLFDSQFKTGAPNDNWFSTASQPRVWVKDVTGDHHADVVGIDSTGATWVAKAAAALPTTSPSGPPSGSFFFQPSLLVRQSAIVDLRLTGGFFSTSTSPRVWLADETGDGVNDFLAIAPTAVSGSWSDGALLWTEVLPTTVSSISSAPPDGVLHNEQIHFTRHVDCSKVSAGLTATTSPPGSVGFGSVTQLNPSTCQFTEVALASATSVTTQFDGLLTTDSWNQSFDGNGNGFLDCLAPPGVRMTDAASSTSHPTTKLLAAAATVDIAFKQTTRVTAPPDPPFPAADGASKSKLISCPDYNGNGNTTDDDCPDARARIIAMSDGATPLILISTELIGINPGRLRDLIAARLGIDSTGIVIAATHSHGVTRTIRLFTAPTYDDRSYEGPPPAQYSYPYPYSYLQWVEDTIAQNAFDVYGAMEPAQVLVNSESGATTNDTNFPSVNRWQGAAPSTGACAAGSTRLNRKLNIIAIQSADGTRPIALIANYALHPVIASGENVGINTDFVGFFSRCLESSSTCPPPRVHFPTAMFLQSGAGDVDPDDTWADLAKDSSEGICPMPGSLPVGQYAINLASKYGFGLAGEATKLLVAAGGTGWQDTTGMKIKVARDVTTLPGISSCHQDTGCVGDDTRPDGSAVNWDLETTSAVVGTVTSHLFAFGTIPGEPFQQVEYNLEDNSTVRNTMLFGYANGYFGYLADDPAQACASQIACNGPARACSCDGNTFAKCLSCAPLPIDTPKGFLCYSSALCSNGSSSFTNGPVYFDFSTPTAGESLANVAASRINALATNAP
jgi:hypothetical protein